jgi:hypothetical protein
MTMTNDASLDWQAAYLAELQRTLGTTKGASFAPSTPAGRYLLKYDGSSRKVTRKQVLEMTVRLQARPDYQR